MSNKLTVGQVRRYVETDGYLSCPYCGSSAMEGRQIESETNRLYQEMLCLTCGKTWVDGYTLDSVGSGDSEDFEFIYPAQANACASQPDIPKHPPTSGDGLDKSAKLTGPHVILSVSGGVAAVLSKPPGVALSIFDYDVEESDEKTSSVGEDPEGQPCCISEWPASESIVPGKEWMRVSQSMPTNPPYGRKWKCPECGRSVDHSYEDLADVGIPICGHCDFEMEMI